jgi:hypothetical protein
MARFVPGSDQTVAEMWAIDGNKIVHRLAGGTIWVDVTPQDVIAANPQEINFLTFNSKLFVSYKSAHNRLHVWDGTSFRRCGIDKSAVPSSFVKAGGTITDTRQYRVSFTKQNGSGVTLMRGEFSDASASQVLAAQQVTVGQPTPPGEGETHWELWAASTASTFGDWRLQATTVIATTTAVDNAALGTTVMDDVGTYTLQPSVKYMASDDSRVIMGGAYELSTNAENAMVPTSTRVWWTPPLGDRDVSDDERVDNTGTINGYADIEESVMGLSQPMQAVTTQATSLERGSFYVFSFQSQWKFIATGDATTPYLRFRITGGTGVIHHKSIVTALDSNGSPSIYWWAPQSGPFRISQNGQEFCGEDIVDLIPTVNVSATIPCHTIYHSGKKQVWFFIATGTSLYPNVRVVFDTRLGRVTDVTGVRKGWSIHTGEGAKAYCSCLFSSVIGASMGLTMQPYIGYTGGNVIWQCDTADTDDAGNAFQAYIDSKSYAPWGLGRQGGMSDLPLLIAAPSPGATIRLLLYRNEGAEVNPSDADLTDPSDSKLATRVFVKFDNAKLGDSYVFSCRIGDAQAISNSWNLDALIMQVSYQGV